MSEPEDPGGPAAPRVSVADEQDRPVDLQSLERLARYALDALGVPESHSLSIALVSPGRMADLKHRFLGERRVTDVLSFPMDPPDAPGPAVLGDVVICPEVAERQARPLGRRVSDEIAQLLVHGILHLFGRDHADMAGERSMAAEERRLLRSFAGVAS